MIRRRLIPSYSLLLWSLMTNNAFATDIADPCDSLFALVDRPTAGDSACVVKYGHIVLEAGYQYVTLYSENGYNNDLPEAELRIGLPYNNELSVLMPTYLRTNAGDASPSGPTATVVGLKHEFPYTEKWTYAIESVVTLPTGNASFGSNGTGVTLNGIFNYNFTPAIAASLTLGAYTQTAPYDDNAGERFNGVSTGLVLTWQTSAKVQVYGEVYGLTKSGPGSDSGYNADAGFQFLPFDNLELDIEYGQRASGSLEDFNHYFGFGGAILL